MAYVHVAHDCLIGNGCILANNATLAGHVVMEDFSYVGGLTPVHQFCRIGTQAFVGGASSINQDIVPFCLAEGAKGGPRAINAIGLKRKGFSDETIKNIKEAFRIIFRSKMLLNDAVAKVEEELGNDENVQIMLNFIKSSNRGIAR
jgi:UDP-N-acetylglucosamine acyltransferase